MRSWAKLSSVLAAGLVAGCASGYVWTTPGIPPVMPLRASDIAAFARNSTCASHHWANDQGRAPSVYTEGVALVFARAPGDGLEHATDGRAQVDVVRGSREAARGQGGRPDQRVWTLARA